MTTAAAVQRAARRLETASRLHREGHLQRAIHEYRQALAVTPQLAIGHLCYGLALASLDQRDEAESALLKALSLDAKLSGAHIALGRLRAISGDLPAAADAFRAALRLDPDSADAAASLWKAAEELELVDEKVTAGRAFVRVRPTVEARWDLALHELAAGELTAGWEGYAERWRHPKYAAWHYPLPQPSWAGEPLAGKRILVWREQGVGDEIMFASCLQDVIERAEHVTLACTSRLLPLFARSFPDADVVDATRITPPDAETFDVDYQCALGGLPRWLRPTIESFPSRPSYLVPDPARLATWRQEVEALGSGLKVGISWRSGLMTADRVKAYSTLDQWGPVLRTPGVHFVNLQYDDCTLALATARDRFGVAIHEFPNLDRRDDFEGMAALIANLDLVLTIGNSVGELSGALGVPAWRLLPTPRGDWTSFNTGRRPWYPTMRIMGAEPTNDWGALLTRVAAELARLT